MILCTFRESAVGKERLRFNGFKGYKNPKPHRREVQRRLRTQALSMEAHPMEALVEATQAHPLFNELFRAAAPGKSIGVDDVDEVWLSATGNDKTAQTLVALDCEMCCTADESMALARVTVVDMAGEVNWGSRSLFMLRLYHGHSQFASLLLHGCFIFLFSATS